jgi:hypothetical protein
MPPDVVIGTDIALLRGRVLGSDIALLRGRVVGSDIALLRGRVVGSDIALLRGRVVGSDIALLRGRVFGTDIALLRGRVFGADIALLRGRVWFAGCAADSSCPGIVRSTLLFLKLKRRPDYGIFLENPISFIPLGPLVLNGGFVIRAPRLCGVFLLKIGRDRKLSGFGG